MLVGSEESWIVNQSKRLPPVFLTPSTKYYWVKRKRFGSKIIAPSPLWKGSKLLRASGLTRTRSVFVWGKLRCPLIVDFKDPCEKHGWDSKWKYARIVRRELNCKTRWFVQIICEGIPYQGRPNTATLDAKSSIDLNISNVAYVGQNKAGLKPFADKVPSFEKEIKGLQRHQDRSRRANNPDNFNPDDIVLKGNKKVRKVKRKGQIKKGKKLE